MRQTTTARSRAERGEHPIPVTVGNFIRAESDRTFARAVATGRFGKLGHGRTMTAIAEQDVARMNRDTLYSSGVFDLAAAPITITLPDTRKRFMSLLVVSQDHFVNQVVYAPGCYTYTMDDVGTRYALVVVRMLANPLDPADMKLASGLQHAIRVEQARAGTFEIPNWDAASRDRVREALESLATMGDALGASFGTRDEVDPIRHLIATAVSWGGNPRPAAVYQSVFPRDNDGKTIHTLTVRDVPVDGFWSISVYNAKGYFEANDRDAYSLNDLTTKPNADGSFTIQLGGCRGGTRNCLPIMPGWNYTVRLYRPRKEVLDGTWRFPRARPLA
jgi:hypothetical protein